MAETDSGQERTEEATPRRLEQAREKGQVPRSRELNTTAMLLAGAGGLLVLGPFALARLAALFEAAFRFDRQLAFEADAPVLQLGRLALEGAIAIAPLCALLFLVAMVTPLSLGGWSFSLQAVAPKLEKLDPVKGLGRIFGPKGLMELLKALAKFVVVSGAAALLLSSLAGDLLALVTLPIEGAIQRTAWLCGLTLLLMALVTVLIAAVDVPFQLWQHARQLRMTRQEIKDEFKETEGRPEVKARIRQLQQELAQRRMMDAVATADVVITNPTHYAVALKYESHRGAPRVVAKGVDQIALAIRERARVHRVTRLEAPPLARALYHTTRLDQEIPPALYLAVAQVLAWVYRLRAAAADGNPAPERPSDLPVPPSLDPKNAS